MQPMLPFNTQERDSTDQRSPRPVGHRDSHDRQQGGHRAGEPTSPEYPKQDFQHGGYPATQRGRPNDQDSRSPRRRHERPGGGQRSRSGGGQFPSPGSDRERGHRGLGQGPNRQQTPTAGRSGGGSHQPAPDPQTGTTGRGHGRHGTHGQQGGQRVGHRPGQEGGGPTPRDQERTNPQRGSTQGYQGRFAHHQGPRRRTQRSQQHRPGSDQDHGRTGTHHQHGHRSGTR